MGRCFLGSFSGGQMASNQKVEDQRPPIKFNFTYWEGFSAFYCIQLAYTPVFIMYNMLVSGIISSTGLTTVQQQIFNRFIIPFYNLQTDLITPPSRQNWILMGVFDLPFFDFRSFNPLKWALNTNPTFFGDTLYIYFKMYISRDIFVEIPI